jgi:hypothetical protein
MKVHVELQVPSERLDPLRQGGVVGRPGVPDATLMRMPKSAACSSSARIGDLLGTTATPRSGIALDLIAAAIIELSAR